MVSSFMDISIFDAAENSQCKKLDKIKPYVTCYVIFIVCTFIDNSCEPISVREFWQLL